MSDDIRGSFVEVFHTRKQHDERTNGLSESGFGIIKTLATLKRTSFRGRYEINLIKLILTFNAPNLSSLRMEMQSTVLGHNWRDLCSALKKLISVLMLQ